MDFEENQHNDDFENELLNEVNKSVRKKYNLSAEAKEARIRNLALGRQKLQAKREKKKLKKQSKMEFLNESESDSSSSDDDFDYSAKLKKSKQKIKDMDPLEAVKAELAMVKKMLAKNKKVVNKTVLQLPQQQAPIQVSQPVENQTAENIKKRLFSMY